MQFLPSNLNIHSNTCYLIEKCTNFSRVSIIGNQSDKFQFSPQAWKCFLRNLRGSARSLSTLLSWGFLAGCSEPAPSETRQRFGDMSPRQSLSSVFRFITKAFKFGTAKAYLALLYSLSSLLDHSLKFTS